MGALPGQLLADHGDGERIDGGEPAPYSSGQSRWSARSREGALVRQIDGPGLVSPLDHVADRAASVRASSWLPIARWQLEQDHVLRRHPAASRVGLFMITIQGMMEAQTRRGAGDQLRPDRTGGPGNRRDPWTRPCHGRRLRASRSRRGRRQPQGRRVRAGRKATSGGLRRRDPAAGRSCRSVGGTRRPRRGCVRPVRSAACSSTTPACHRCTTASTR